MVIIKPVITEKSLKLAEKENQYTFIVKKNINKIEIIKAVEGKFNVKVLKARIINVLGKKVSFGQKRIKGKKRDYKKIILTLKVGDKIPVFNLK